VSDAITAWHAALVQAYALFAALLIAKAVWLGRQPRWEQWLYCSVSILFLFVARWPAALWSAPFNPDEAQMVASAMKFALDPIPWRSVDTTSSGPLNSMVLMWPNLFGGDVTLASARLTGLALISGAWLCVHGSLRDVAPPARSGATAAMMVLLIAAGGPDYLSYSSELLSVLLLSCAFWLCTRFARGTLSKAGLLGAGVALGTLPWTKLQAVPVALVLGLGAVLIVWVRSRSWRNVTLLAIGALTPAVALLALLACVGELPEMWNSYLGWSLDFVADRGPLTPWLSVIQYDPAFMPYFVGCVALGLLGLLLDARTHVSRLTWVWPLAFAFLGSSFYAVLVAGTMFQHYLLFLLVPLALWAGSTWTANGRLPWILCGSSHIALLGVVGWSALAQHQLEWEPAKAVQHVFRHGTLLSWLPEGRGRLLVWGWQPEYHVYSGLAPATRDTHTWNQIVPSARRDEFRRRLLRDFEADPPAVVIDSVYPGAFHFSSPEECGLQAFPELAAIVAERFARVSAEGNACPRTYVRKDVLASLRLAEFRAITASAYLEYGQDKYAPELVDDFNIYENCVDRWLLPDYQLGSITLQLERREKVSAIRLLNTKNGAFTSRSSLSATVALMDGDEIAFEQSVELDPYPDWTVLPIASTWADSLRIDITSFAGAGGGLNEVKVELAR
jgi:hypothetical protein